MAEKDRQADMSDGLKVEPYSRSACLAAIRGEQVPHGLGHSLHRLCTIRGIRYHHGFGHELSGVLPPFARALNARSIMSNTIPDMRAAEDIPYCIWHPDIASEDTYRGLAQRYPQMVYQIARACAVAGYATLYHELDVLPDVHVAEEARECGNTAIYESIMAQNVRYSIMNDYTRSIDITNRRPAYLNGDTAVRWMLDSKQKFKDAENEFWETDDGHYIAGDFFGSMGYEETTFNLTEDFGIDEDESSNENQQKLATHPDQELLHQPLPPDLPTVDKDLLIVMAAYSGNIDRYVRLRRPQPVYGDRECCVGGIYHNTFFAV